MSESLMDKLRTLAGAGDMDGLEEAWLEALEDPGPAASFLESLDALDPAGRRERSLAWLPLVLETYDGLARHEDALAVARRLAELQPKEPAIRRVLIKQLKKVHGEENWFEGFIRASRLEEGIPMDQGLALFDAFAPYKTGAAVEHGRGWGAGVIEGFNPDSWDLKIRFEDGYKRELPLTSAVESLKPLDPDDLRVMVMTRKEELQGLAMDDPSRAIRMVLALQPAKKHSAAMIKAALVDKAIPAADWSRWWSRAKVAAAKDPYLHVEGGSRPLIRLRNRPVSMEEEARSRVAAARDIPEAVARVREYILSKPDKALKGVLLESVKERVTSGLASEERACPLLDGILLLEEHGFDPPVTAVELLRRETTPEGEGNGAGGGTRLFHELTPGRSRLLALVAFEKAFPDHWHRMLTEEYPELPRDLLDPAAELLVKRGHAAALMKKFRALMATPWQAPWSIFYLVRRVAGGGVAAGTDGMPKLTEMALAMLRCMESPLFQARGTKHQRREITKRYEELLFDAKRAVLRRFMEEGDRAELTRAIHMVHLTSPISDKIQDYLRSEVGYRYPELIKEKAKPFWAEETIYCTQKGIDRRKKELRIITEEKLPEVSKAIGRAASFGDLSENAEWTAALEDQRLLTEKAAMIQEELETVRALEDQSIPEDVVAPGTRITLQREENGSPETYTILGPWDVGDEGVVSYKAPLAAPLLGSRKGDRVTVILPDKSYEVTVLSVERVDLG